MDTNQKGVLTELEVMLYITKLGYTVSVPYGDRDRYDQIWDINNKLYRVQVKTSRWKDENHKAFIFKCRSYSNGVQHRYTKEQIDFFATMWDGKCYLVPVEQCSSEKALWLEHPTASNPNGAQMASQYEIEEVLKTL